MIFRIEAQGDIVYVEADTADAAADILFEKIGKMPRSLLTITKVDVLPDGEELL